MTRDVHGVLSGALLSTARLAVAATLAASCGGDAKPEEQICGDADSGELGPNNVLASAPRLDFGRLVSGCVDAAGDSDYYLFRSSGNAAGGVVTATLENRGEARVSISFHLLAGESTIATLASAAGEGVTGYLAVAPNTFFAVRVFHDLAAAFPPGGYGYTLRLAHTDVRDAHEPNDTRTQARAIGKDRDVRGRLFAGYREPDVPPSGPGAILPAPAPAAYDDWYKVRLAAGQAVVQVTQVPANLAVAIELYGAGDVELACRAGCIGNPGQELVTASIPVEAGDHWLRVTRQLAPAVVVAGRGPELPVSFTQDYVLRVTQP